MSTDHRELLQSFREYIKKMGHYNEALALMHWDMRTGAPRKGIALRSEAIGTLSGEVFRMNTSPEMEDYLERLSEPAVFDQLSPIDQATVREVKREFERNKQVPADRYQAFVVLVSQAQAVWEEAKATADFERFRPYLERIVDMTREFIGYWGHGADPYDTLLDMYERGMTVARLDAIFGRLRDETVSLLRRIVESGRKPRTEIFRGTFDANKQRELSRYLLERIGYDFAAGRLDETVHPFATSINRFDVRVTSRFPTDDLRPSVFGTIHEGGHALYEQGISTDLIGTPLSTGTSMGIHESQSRFYENMIGRSREFWEANYRELQRLFPNPFKDVSLADFHFAINSVEPSFIRIEADELTYNLHIMIRYELEKGLINQTIEVRDLPELWREKMRDYLGVVPESDAQGVLQDVHWSAGMFGYFPSYSLGNIYAAQFRHALAQDIPDYAEQIRRGEMQEIRHWLNEKIHRHGKLLEPAEIVQKVTGQQIDSTHLVEYFKEKFGALYGLS